jgi:hypothetical protein
VKQFRHDGYFEEVLVSTPVGWRLAGKRTVCPANTPELVGAESETESTITSPISLYSGCGTAVTVKASVKNPVKIKTRIYPLCGPLQ